MSERSRLEMYQAFMAGYVRRINLATLNVTIGGIRIGTAKYTRLAQINLTTRIITFSRFAIENVPERGRRYLVLHELAHVKEANHNRRFWELVERYEPSYKQIGHALDLSFKRNVKEEQQNIASLKLPNPNPNPNLLLSPHSISHCASEPEGLPQAVISQDEQDADFDSMEDSFVCREDQFESWDDAQPGTMQGGSDIEIDTMHGGSSLIQIAV